VIDSDVNGVNHYPARGTLLGARYRLYDPRRLMEPLAARNPAFEAPCGS
jgi:hypothetical protein